MNFLLVAVFEWLRELPLRALRPQKSHFLDIGFMMLMMRILCACPAKAGNAANNLLRSICVSFVDWHRI